MSKIKHLILRNWAIVLTLFLAAFLRLYKIADYMTFLGDEGRDVLIVYGILHGKLTLLGPTASVGGFFLGPIYYYFMTPFLWLFNYNPVGPSVMVALFGIATVWLIYKIASEFFNKTAGLIASLLYAISPVVIAYSRSSWNPNVVPFFSLLALYSIYKGLSKKNNKWIIACGFFLGVGLQLHYLITFLFLIILVYVLASKLFLEKGLKFFKRISLAIKDYLLILAGLVVGWLPFLAFEFRHGFQNVQSIFSFILKSDNAGSNNKFFEIIYDVLFRIYGRLVFAYPPTERINNYSKTLISSWEILIVLVAILSSFLLIYSLLKNLKNREKFLQMSLLTIWLILGVALFGFYKKSIYDYYFGFIFPLPFLLIGNLTSSALLKAKFTVKLVSIVFVIFIVYLNIQGMPFRYPPNRQLNQMETIARFVVDKAGGKPYNFALITGGNSDHAYRYFFKLWSKPSVVIEYSEKDPQRKTATDQLFVVCEINPCYPLGHSLWEIAGFGRAEITGEWDVSVVKIYKLVHYKGK
jgi:4-amino-4-deoxy-L-arabinose transferase-like glycosyltransferase